MPESNENENVESNKKQDPQVQGEETPKVEVKDTPKDQGVKDPKGEVEDTSKGQAEAAPPEEPAPPPKPVKTAPPLPEGIHYIWGTGRRKASIARVRIKPGTGKVLINKREVVDYFKKHRDQETAMAPLKAVGMTGSFDIFVNVGGGGSTGQAGAVSLGVARALAKHMPDNEHDLRSKGLLTRDARMKERKKPGQPGARKSFQFSKR